METIDRVWTRYKERWGALGVVLVALALLLLCCCASTLILSFSLLRTRLTFTPTAPPIDKDMPSLTDTPFSTGTCRPG